MCTHRYALTHRVTHVLNKLRHVQITFFSHSIVLTMEQQRACNHTAQNTVTNSNYLVESMSSTGSHCFPIPLYPSLFVPEYPAHMNKLFFFFFLQYLTILICNCMQLLFPFSFWSAFNTGATHRVQV